MNWGNKFAQGQISYGLLGLPLAMAALPIYVQIPSYYTMQLGLPLASTGVILFLARLIDTVQDPWLGRVIDRQQNRVSLWFYIGGLMLALAFAAMWLPPTAHLSGNGLLAWLALCMIVAYTAHSMLNIAYLAWGARLVNQAVLGAAAWREGMGLFGVILASVIPAIILQTAHPVGLLAQYCAGFAFCLLLAILALLHSAAKPTPAASDTTIAWSSVFANQAFRRILPLYFINALASAIPATLALFFMRDQLQAEAYAGHFLAAYFIAGAAGLPFWVWYAKRIGYARAWRVSMLLAIVSFCGTSLLGSGDLLIFGLLCLASGLALGADLALPPSILAALIPSHHSAASYFGIWTLLGKLALACAPLGLPLLSFLGYVPGQTQGTLALTLVYAILPCILKLLAVFLLTRYLRLYGQQLDMATTSINSTRQNV